MIGGRPKSHLWFVALGPAHGYRRTARSLRQGRQGGILVQMWLLVGTEFAYSTASHKAGGVVCIEATCSLEGLSRITHELPAYEEPRRRL